MLKALTDRISRHFARKNAAKSFDLSKLSAEDLQTISRPIIDNLTPAELTQIFGVVAGDKSFRVSVPDANIGYLAQPHIEFAFWNKTVKINNAGLRSSVDFKPKAENTHRIIFLGDSYVFGDGVEERDRFSNQVADFLTEHHIKVDGKQIEVLSIGLGGWNMVQETSYLIPRLSEYKPDTVVMLVLENDLAPNLPFSHGRNSNRYSPEERSFGSGYLCDFLNYSFGDRSGRGAVCWLDTPTANAYWDKALSGLKRLEDLLSAQGGNFLITAMNPVSTSPGPFVVRLEHKIRAAGLSSPYLPVTFLRTKDRVVIGDSHPNAEGHAIMRDQYLRALHSLGWIPLPDEIVPPPHPEIDFEIDGTLRHGHHDWYINKFREDCILPEIDFRNLEPAHSRAFLAGILPASHAPDETPTSNPPWASTRAIFIMKAPAPDKTRFVLDIDIPRRPELFPLTITVTVDEAHSTSFTFSSVKDAGPKILEVDFDCTPDSQEIEIALYADAFISGIENNAMRSFRLLHARFE